MYLHILYQLSYDASCIKSKITVIRHVTMIARYKTAQEMYSPNTVVKYREIHEHVQASY